MGRTGFTRPVGTLAGNIRSDGRRVAVLGIGNLVMRDDGVGVHLAQRLSGMVTAENVRVIDGGTSADFVSMLDANVDRLIIVDAANGGCEPGTIYRFTPDDLVASHEGSISMHEMGILESLKLMEVLGVQPKSTVIFGVEPEVIGFGTYLSPEIEMKFGRLIELVLKEINMDGEAEE